MASSGRRLVALVLVFFTSCNALKMNSWQARLDKAVLSVDLGVGSRLRLLSKALQDPKLVEDVTKSAGILREQGFGKGHPEVINILYPSGTTARSDLEGLTALRKQVPEALAELQNSPPELPANPGSVLNELPAPADVISTIGTLIGDSEKQKELREEAKDLLRSTPKSLETPCYTVVRVVDGPEFLGAREQIELRAYEEFTVARTPMAADQDDYFGSSKAGAKGFNTLASYLFGGNEGKEAMAMTMPVEITAPTQAGGDGTMAFVLPKKNAAVPPSPLPDSEVTIATVAPRVVAAKAFPGLVTDQEVKRQKQALLDALAADGSVVPMDEQVSVLQYNGPLTLPWRRRNEMVVVVKDVERVEEVAQVIDEVEDSVGEVRVTSWYDSGVRL